MSTTFLEYKCLRCNMVIRIEGSRFPDPQHCGPCPQNTGPVKDHWWKIIYS